jgi:curved DNA-binding protein CbpA
VTRGGDGPEIDPYKTLQVDPDADVEIIQVVYRRLARMNHPDVLSDPDAQARMTAINAAWEILGDPLRRAAYDRGRASRAMASGPAGTAGDAGEGRAAEATHATDPAGPPERAGASTPPGGNPRSGHGSTASPSAQPGSTGGPGASPGPGADTGSGAGGSPRHQPETVSRDWSSGRSSTGGGYDPARMRTADGDGAAGPPPGRPSGTVLNFGRYAGWSLGEIGRTDLEYLEWLDRMTIGRTYRDELDAILRTAGRRRSAPIAEERRGLFRRR